MPPGPRGPCHLAVTGFAASHILAQPWAGGGRGPEKRRHQPRSHGPGAGARRTRVPRAPAAAARYPGSVKRPLRFPHPPAGGGAGIPSLGAAGGSAAGAGAGRAGVDAPGQLGQRLRARPPGARGSGARVSGERRRPRHCPDRATAPPLHVSVYMGPPTFRSPDSGARATAVPAPPLAGNTTPCQGRGPCERGFPRGCDGGGGPPRWDGEGLREGVGVNGPVASGTVAVVVACVLSLYLAV